MKAQIEISGSLENLKILEKVFVEKHEDSRSRAKIYLTGDKLLIQIDAEDLTALRASVNSHLRIIRACIETLEVIGNG